MGSEEGPVELTTRRRVGARVEVRARQSERATIVERERGDPSSLRHIRVSAVIPVLNEAQNIPHVFPRLPSELFETIMVDGGSTDGSIEVARGLLPDVRIVTQDRRGKGNALECGFRACRGDIVVFLDADGSTDPAEIPRFVTALLEGADFAKGSRFASGGSSLDITPARERGNRVLCGIVNRLYGTAYTDLCYGYNAFWRSMLPALGFTGEPNGRNGERRRGDGFEVETMINVRAAMAGLAVTEVPSVEWARIHGSSKLNAITDGLRVLSVIGLERRAWKRGRYALASVIGRAEPAPACCANAATAFCRCAEDSYA
jgi:glycosyltransferase involved in cell wall biosynthesis